MDNKAILEELKSIRIYMLLGSKTALDMNDASLLTGLSKSRLYALVSDRAIPHSKRGKKVYFDKRELEEWMLEDRISSSEEINREALSRVYCKGNG